MRGQGLIYILFLLFALLSGTTSSGSSFAKGVKSKSCIKKSIGNRISACCFEPNSNSSECVCHKSDLKLTVEPEVIENITCSLKAVAFNHFLTTRTTRGPPQFS